MPWFRFTNDARVVLPFRNGGCELTFANVGGELPWAWVAQKRTGSGQQVVLLQTGNIVALRVALFEEGFCVDAGSAAEKVMQAAVKCGHAEDLPDDERWRRELLSARAALQRSAKPEPRS